MVEEQNIVALSGEWCAASELYAWETCNLMMVKVEEAGEGCETLERSF